VGDALEMADGTPVTIEAIKSVIKQGVYAPFTMSGSLVVNNVKASSYVSFQDDADRLVVGGWETPLSFQWIAHLSQSPHRLAWRLGMVGVEEYTETGLSTWVSGPHHLSMWLMAQNDAILVAVLTPTIALGLVSSAFESAVSLFF
jgi:Hint module